jgi:23S rRNA (uracil1939-C5)-methyltransferase
VTGIEYVAEAIKDAWENSELNRITNVSFHAGDILDVLNDEFIAEHGKPDVVITDPPRAGMHEKVVRKILELSPEKIVYVSCNPATQARDIAILSEHYSVLKAQPVDMFPQTQHVENVALLSRQG